MKKKYCGLPVLKVDDDDDVLVESFVGSISDDRLERLGKIVHSQALSRLDNACRVHDEAVPACVEANNKVVGEAMSIAADYMGGKISERTPEQDQKTNDAAARAMQAVRRVDTWASKIESTWRTCRNLGLLKDEDKPAHVAFVDATGPEPVMAIAHRT